ncbi:MAG: TonB-dependent receptor [Prevotella sp.]|nr:TonB-dependent receptor [Prevotella sp.]
MYKPLFNKRKAIIFKHFTNKGYALFACLGKEVIVGTLSASTLTYAKADGISTRVELAADSLSRQEVKLDEVVVTGSRTPLSAWKSPRIVALICREDISRTGASTINDVLKFATGVDVRQRGGFGVQTDISINGGTFDQITILLNGINISNPQTGHNATDFPVSLSDIDHIEILEGASSRLFGSSAFSGAINIVTSSQAQDRFAQVGLEGGSYGTMFAEGQLYHQPTNNHSFSISGGYGRSDGTENSDFEKERLFYQGIFRGKKIDIHWQMAVSGQNFGANTFYSTKYNNQYEKTLHGILSVSADIRPTASLAVKPSLYFNRFNDHYQLTRHLTGANMGENYHQMDVWGGLLNLYYDSRLGKSSIGADIRNEHILSTAYGEAMDATQWKDIHGSDRHYDHEGKRTNISLFAEHNILWKQWTLSAGLLYNRVTSPTPLLAASSSWSPGIDISYRPNQHWKLTASWNKAIRIPTYTDLYTNNVAQKGDPNLKPEKNSTTKIAARWKNANIVMTANAFYSHGTDMIDWVYERESSTQYHALNIGKIDNMGVSISVAMTLNSLSPTLPSHAPQLTLGYAFIHQDHDTQQPIFKSLYALEYLRHKVTVQLSQRIWKSLSASCQFRWQQRTNGFHPYSKIDAKLAWETPRYDLFIKADNITNHRYYDIGTVLQPGIWVMVGGAYKFPKK